MLEILKQRDITIQINEQFKSRKGNMVNYPIKEIFIEKLEEKKNMSYSNSKNPNSPFYAKHEVKTSERNSLEIKLLLECYNNNDIKHLLNSYRDVHFLEEHTEILGFQINFLNEKEVEVTFKSAKNVEEFIKFLKENRMIGTDAFNQFQDTIQHKSTKFVY